MNWTRLLTVLAALLLWAGPAPGASAAPPPQQGNRFLIVVDTAAAMRGSSNGVERAIFELFKSDMKGEFRPGDTIGFWTYSEHVMADYPMQVWSEARRKNIEEGLVSILREQGYRGRAHLEKVMPAIREVVASSRRVTVLLIFDGNEPVSGTPYDGDINELLKQFGPKMRSEHRPFIVALAAKDGAIFDYTVNTPGSISIPHTALPWPAPVTNAPPVVEVKPAPPPAPAPPPPPRRHIEIVMTGRNAIVLTNEGNATATNVPANRNEIVVSAPKPAPASPVETNTAVSTAAASPPSSPPSAAVNEKPSQTPPPAQAFVPNDQNLPASPGPKVALTAPSPNTTSNLPSPDTTPTNLTPAVNAVAPADSKASAPPPSTTPTVLAPSSPAPTPSPANIAAPAPSAQSGASGGTEVALFIIAFSLLAIAVALIWFLVRRSRGGPASLITQSMDRPR